MDVPPDAAATLLGALSLLIGIAVSQRHRLPRGRAGFWLVETRGVQVLYMVVSGFFAGLFMPIDLFPDWLLTVVSARRSRR